MYITYVLWPPLPNVWNLNIHNKMLAILSLLNDVVIGTLSYRFRFENFGVVLANVQRLLYEINASCIVEMILTVTR